MVQTGSNVGIAFAITICAGLSTAVGASLVFFPRFIKYANRSTLACALGFSAGVMTYVSFVEIFYKSVTSFELAGYLHNTSYKLATLCFFCGIIFMILLNATVKSFLHERPEEQRLDEGITEEESSCDSKKKEDMKGAFLSMAEDGKVEGSKVLNHKQQQQEYHVGHCHTCSDDPVGDFERIKSMAVELEEKDLAEQYLKNKEHTSNHRNDLEENWNAIALPNEDKEREAKVMKEKEQKKLTLISINTAVAIALHNFPEGLATFVAVLNDPKVGLVLAFAITIHNIPEGICVALPVYYASGSRRKAFLLALLSGISEPIAAIFAWLVLASIVGDVTYAVLFGLVSGIMVIICTREILPTAHRYDPEDKYVTISYIVGMAVMATSLVLFVV